MARVGRKILAVLTLLLTLTSCCKPQERDVIAMQRSVSVWKAMYPDYTVVVFWKPEDGLDGWRLGLWMPESDVVKVYDRACEWFGK